MTDQALIIGADQKLHCYWCGHDEEYQRYHDEEWGWPVKDDQRLFEKICLEGFQSGLSWITILRKRENFRQAFDGFDYKIVKHYDDQKVEELLQNAGIIRHRGKIEAVINNANCMEELLKEFPSFANYIWSYEPDETNRPQKFDYETLSQITQSEESIALSKDLKKRGWKFVGPTTCYAFMQSMGLVNDHFEGCFMRDVIEQKRKDFQRP
ncbi:MAG: DNA-3-methyladenine glycosylase I [Pseudomonadota bacterium]